jgi:hypothetical protein
MVENKYTICYPRDVLIPQGESQNCARLARKTGWGSDGPGNAARQIFPNMCKDPNVITHPMGWWPSRTVERPWTRFWSGSVKVKSELEPLLA